MTNPTDSNRCSIESASSIASDHGPLSEQFYLELFNATSDALFVHDTSGRMLDVNLRACSMFRCDRKSLLDGTVEIFSQGQSPYSAVEALEKITQAVTLGPQLFEWRSRRNDGELFWTEVALRATSIGGVQRIIASVRDISERKAIEAALRDSEERFRSLSSIATEGVMIHEGGIIVDANRAMAEIAGLTDPSELIGKHGVEAIPLTPESKQRIIDNIRSRSSETIDVEIVRPDGTVVPAETYGRATVYRGRPARLAYMRDISERKRAEQKLKNNERRLSLAISATADAIWERNLRTNEAYYSPRWYKMLGYEDQQFPMVHDTFKTLCHPDDLQPTLECIETTLSSPQSSGYDAEFRMRAADGSWLWILGRGNVVERDSEGHPLILSGTNTNVTERKRAEHALAEKEHRFSVMIQNFSDMLLILDLDGTAHFVSPACEAILGYTSKELLGKSAYSFIHPDDTSRVHEIMASLLASKDRTVVVEFRYIHRDASVRWVEASGTNLVDDPAIGGFVLAVRDITRRRQSELENARLAASLRQAQKMESIGRLAGGVAHDFNNLLTVISGNVSLALMELQPQDPLQEPMGEIGKAVESAANLTRQLLAFSRKQVIDPRVVNLNTVVERLHKLLRRVLGEDIELRIALSDDLGQVRIDPGQLEQIIVNLAVNARDAMPDGGKLTLETANIRLDESYCREHIHVQPGEFILLAVSDNGTGIEDDAKAHLFEPFFTTKEQGKGTGLGLAMVYGAVTQHKGTIEVYSELGRGTTFKVYLPRVDEQPEHLRDGPKSRIPRGHETILLVEDEAMVRDLAAKLLKRQGYRVHAFANGAEALLAAGEMNDPIHLLITDVVMPGINGRALADNLVALRPTMKVLFTSGYTGDVIVYHGMLERGVEFVAKPYSLEQLAERVREVLDGDSKS
jgi:PAS domain S-box-containing protein